MTLKEAYDAWRGVPFNPDRPVGTILSDRELVLTQDAFKAGALYASDEAKREAEEARELLENLNWLLEDQPSQMRDRIRAHLERWSRKPGSAPA